MTYYYQVQHLTVGRFFVIAKFCERSLAEKQQEIHLNISLQNEAQTGFLLNCLRHCSIALVFSVIWVMKGA